MIMDINKIFPKPKEVEEEMKRRKRGRRKDMQAKERGLKSYIKLDIRKS